MHIDKNQFEHLDKLQKLRNPAVHFALPGNPKQMNSLLAKGCNFVWDFGKENLPNDGHLKSSGWKQISDNLRQFDLFVKERMRTVQPLIPAANRVLHCERCGQPTLRIGEGKPNCVFCGYEVDPTELAEEISEAGLEECPSCEERACALLILNNDLAVWGCMACGQREKPGEYNPCPRCGCLTAEGGLMSTAGQNP